MDLIHTTVESNRSFQGAFNNSLDQQYVSPFQYAATMVFSIIVLSVAVSFVPANIDFFFIPVPYIFGLGILIISGFVFNLAAKKLLVGPVLVGDNFSEKVVGYFLMLISLYYTTQVSFILMIVAGFFFFLETNPIFGVTIIVVGPLLNFLSHLPALVVIASLFIFVQGIVLYFVTRYRLRQCQSGGFLTISNEVYASSARSRFKIWVCIGLAVLINILGVLAYVSYGAQINAGALSARDVYGRMAQEKQAEINKYNELLYSPEQVEKLVVVDEKSLQLLKAIAASPQQKLTDLRIRVIVDQQGLNIPIDIYKISSIESLTLAVEIDDSLIQESPVISIPQKINELDNLRKLSINISIPPKVTNYERNTLPSASLELPDLSGLVKLSEFNLTRQGERELWPVRFLGELPNSVEVVRISGIKKYSDLLAGEIKNSAGEVYDDGPTVDLASLLPSSSQAKIRSISIEKSNFEIQRLVDRMSVYPSLMTLELNNNYPNLTFLPDNIGKIVGLRDLDISNNSISELPATLNQLQLKKFRAAATCIPFDAEETVPDELKSLFPYVEKFYVYYRPASCT
jgi:hypothetical protein